MNAYFSKLTKRPYLFYTFIFAVIAIAVFVPHLLGGGTLIWGGDGIAQHYPAMVFAREEFRELLFHGHSIPGWQWKIGLGQDFIQTFSYYLLGDPFFYPTILLPEKLLPDYYSIMVIVRLYLAGLAFIFAASRLINAQSFSLSLGGIVYVFSGYTAYSTFSHPFFLNPLILFPFLIVSLKKVLKGGSMLPFIGMVALTLIVNFYFAYILAAGCAVYFVIELITSRPSQRWRNALRAVAAALNGFLISACLFVPSLYFLFNSARTGGKVANGLKVYPFAYYLSLPGTMLVPRVTSEFWLRGGLMVLGLLGVMYVWRRFKEYHTLGLIYLVTIICLLSPVLCGILNGFSSPSNRWLLLFQLPLALSSVILIDNSSKLEKKDFRLFIIVGGIIGISLLLTSDFGHYDGDLGMLVFQYLFAATIFLLFKKYGFKIKGILTVLVIFNAATIFLSIQPYNVKAKNKLLSKETVLNLVERQKGYQKKIVDNYDIDPQSLDPADQNFKRSYIDTQIPSYIYYSNLPILSPVNSFETYWSLEGDGVYQFMHELGVNTSIPNDITGNGDLRDNLFNYLGINQIWLNQNSTIVPASYHNYEPNLYNDQLPYLSDSSYPLFYFPQHLISLKSYNKMSPTQKEASLMDSVAVEGGDEESNLANKVQKVPFYNETIYYPDGEHLNFETQTPEQVKVQSPAGQVVLLLPANSKLADKELHLEFSNLSYQPFDFQELWQADLVDYKAEHNNNNLKGVDDFQTYDPSSYKYKWIARNYLKFGRVKPGYVLTAEYLDRKNSFKQLSPKRLSGYEKRNNITLNLGPADRFNKEQWILLNTDTLAHFSFDLKLVAIPTTSAIKKTARQVRENSHKNLNFKIGQDQIDLKVKRPVKKIVATTIPYSPGWKINHGKIVKVNKTFIGIKLEPGQKNYQLKYRTPFLNIGLIMSTIGIMITLTIVGWQRHQCNKE